MITIEPWHYDSEVYVRNGDERGVRITLPPEFVYDSGIGDPAVARLVRLINLALQKVQETT